MKVAARIMTCRPYPISARLFVLIAAAVLFALPASAATPSASASDDDIRTISGSYLAGRFAQARRDVVAAARYYGHALKHDPEAPDLLRRTFILTLMAGDMEKAAALAEQLTSTDNPVPLAPVALAARAMRGQDWGTVEKLVSPLPDTGLNVFTKPLFLAWAKVGAGDTAAALKTLGALAKTDGASVLHDLHAALINDLAGNFDAAVKLLVKVTESQPSPTLRLTILLGSLYERMGQHERARALYTLFQSEHPNSSHMRDFIERVGRRDAPPVLVATASDGAAEALFGIARILQAQNNSDPALVLGRLALFLKPDFPNMRYIVGEILEGEGRLEEAIATYRGIAKNSAFAWPAGLRTASALEELKRVDEAAVLLRDMAKQRTDDPAPLITLGDVLRGKKAWIEAIAAYDQAMERVGTPAKHHWRLFNSRAIALERAKMWPRAEADFLKALEFQPDQPFVLNYLGYSWLEQGLHLDRALAMIQTAVRQRPKDGYIVDSLGWGYYQLGDYENAVRELERAVELRPQDPIINDHLGDAYWRAGREREASFQWNHALANGPDEDVRHSIEAKLKNGLPPLKEEAKGAKSGKPAKPNGG